MSYVLKVLEDTWGAALAGPDRSLNTKLTSNDDDPYRYAYAKQWPGDQLPNNRKKIKRKPKRYDVSRPQGS